MALLIKTLSFCIVQRMRMPCCCYWATKDERITKSRAHVNLTGDRFAPTAIDNGDRCANVCKQDTFVGYKCQPESIIEHKDASLACCLRSVDS